MMSCSRGCAPWGAALLGMALPMAVPALAQGPEVKPNIIYIFPDEFRRQAMGFWSRPEYAGALNGTSDPVVTPTLDKLAGEGVVFTQAVSTQPVCSPYRGMLMTGTFPPQNGISRNCWAGNNEQLKKNAFTLTDILNQNGYSTAYFGKVHWEKTEPLFDVTGNFANSRTAPGGNYIYGYDTYVPPGPSRHGNQYWFQNIRDNHFNPYSYSSDPGAVGGKSDGQVFKPQGFTAELEADRILRFLKNTSTQKRDMGKPFSIFWALNPPHMPYRSLADVDSAAFNAHYRNLPLAKLLNRPNVSGSRADNAARYYFSNVTGTDKQIGRVLDWIDSSGHKDNTIVVFTSDHGEMLGSHDLMEKNVEYEEAFGVPFLIRYPARLKHHVNNLLLGTTDIMPTLLGLMGLAAKIPPAVRGTDYSGLLIDPKTATVAKPLSAFYLHHEGEPGAMDGKVGVRTDKYTFAIDKSCQVVSLYDNISDPYQMKNLTFASLPSGDQRLLKMQLGHWLAKSEVTFHKIGSSCGYVSYAGTKTGSPDPTGDRISDFRILPGTGHSTIRIQIRLLNPDRVTIRIFHLDGRVLKTVWDETLSGGTHFIPWNGSEGAGGPYDPAMYLLECRTGKSVRRIAWPLLRASAGE